MASVSRMAHVKCDNFYGRKSGWKRSLMSEQKRRVFAMSGSMAKGLKISHVSQHENNPHKCSKPDEAAIHGEPINNFTENAANFNNKDR